MKSSHWTKSNYQWRLRHQSFDKFEEDTLELKNPQEFSHDVQLVNDVLWHKFVYESSWKDDPKVHTHVHFQEHETKSH
jgi:hypothetical protein